MNDAGSADEISDTIPRTQRWSFLDIIQQIIQPHLMLVRCRWTQATTSKGMS